MNSVPFIVLVICSFYSLPDVSPIKCASIEAVRVFFQESVIIQINIF